MQFDLSTYEMIRNEQRLRVMAGERRAALGAGRRTLRRRRPRRIDDER